MKLSDDKPIENRLKLLSDSDFAALMDAEYTSSMKPDDALAKQRIWKNIEEKISASGKPSIGNMHTARRHFATAATLLLAIVSLPFIFYNNIVDNTFDNAFNNNGEFERVKGNDDINGISLYMYTLDATGALTNSDEYQNVGTTLVFKVHGTQQGVASLILSRNGSLTSNGIKYPLSQNADGQLLSIKDKVYGYMIEPTDKIVQFCIVTAENERLLENKLENLKRSWDQLPAKSCTTVNVTDSLR